MSISVQCSCGKVYTVPDTMAGTIRRCKECGTCLTVPTASNVTPPAPASAPSPNNPAHQATVKGEAPERQPTAARIITSKKAIPKTLAGFTIERHLGQLGQISSVFLARNSAGEAVALKILPPEIMDTSPKVGKRFLREARIIAGLRHPNLVSCLDAGEDLGTFYLVMEYFPSCTLKQRMEEQGGRIPENELLAVGIQVAAGIGHLAEHHLVHRNIKPEHILINEEGKVKLTGMGLVRATEADGQMLTAIGGVVGTAHYMSPEHATGKRELDVRSDLYSLGITFYEALCGVVPFDDSNMFKIILQHVNAPLPPLKEKNPAVSDAMNLVVTKLLAKAPEQRYQSAQDLAQDLKAIEQGQLINGLPPILAKSRSRQTTTNEMDKLSPPPLNMIKVLIVLTIVLSLLVIVLILALCLK